MMTDDTIAAIATASGTSGIAIIRVSGPQALAIADQIFHCKGARPSERETHTIVWGRVMDAGQLVDEALLLIMRAPRRRANSPIALSSTTAWISCRPNRLTT